MSAPGRVECVGGGVWGSCRLCERDVAVDAPVPLSVRLSESLGWVADAVRAHLRDEHGEGT